MLLEYTGDVRTWCFLSPWRCTNLVFLEQVLDTDDVLAVVLRAELGLHVSAPLLQFITQPLEGQCLRRKNRANTIQSADGIDE